MLVQDNLDLCCQVIEKAAGERAQREIDERLQNAYAARARAKAAGQPYADAAVMQGRFPSACRRCCLPAAAGSGRAGGWGDCVPAELWLMNRALHATGSLHPKPAARTAALQAPCPRRCAPAPAS